eukprot:gene12838-14158_t
MIINHIHLATFLFLAWHLPVSESTCHVNADIALIVDGSRSVGTKLFSDFITALEAIVRSFDFSATSRVRFALMTYGEGSGPDIHFNFNAHTTKDGYLEAIAQLTRPAYPHTYTGVAFTTAKTEFFGAGNERSGAAKVLVLLTDGSPTDPSTVDGDVQSVKDAGIQVLPIAIGDGIEERFLRKWASDPNFNLRIAPEDLAGEVQKVANLICTVTEKAAGSSQTVVSEKEDKESEKEDKDPKVEKEVASGSKSSYEHYHLETSPGFTTIPWLGHAIVSLDFKNKIPGAAVDGSNKVNSKRHFLPRALKGKKLKKKTIIKKTMK